MRVFRLTFLLLLILSDWAFSQELVFLESDSYTEKAVRKFVGKNKSNNDVDSISNFLSDLGYYDNTVKSEKTNNTEQISIITGDHYNFRRLIISGDKNDTLQLPNSTNNAIFNDILNSYIHQKQNNGYYFSSVNLREVVKDKNNIDLHYNLQLGPAVTVSSIEYRGLKRTDEKLITRYNKINIGDTLILSEISEGMNSIEKAGFISIDGEPRIIPDPGLNTAGISYDFHEIRQFYIEGSGGYIPDDDGYFVWYLNLMGNNIFGRGQNGSLLVDQREKNRSILSISYSQPVFLISTGEIGVDFQTRDYREQFYEFGVNLHYTFYANNNISINTLLGWKNVEPVDSLSQSYANYSAGVGVAIGEIKDFRQKNSSYINWIVNYHSRNYKPSTDSTTTKSVYNDIRNQLTLAGQYSLGALLSNYHKLVLSDIETSEKPIPYSELILIGGPKNLRGYRNGQFAVNRSVVISTEAKFYFSEKDYIYPFIDFAYLWQLDSEFEEKTIRKQGFGLGFSLFSNERSFKIELSWAKGTAFDQPRVHAIVNARF